MGSFCSPLVISIVFKTMLTSNSKRITLKFEVIGTWKKGSDRSELIGGSFCVVLDWTVLGCELENSNPVEGEEATSGTVVLGLLVVCKGEAGVSLGEAGLEGIFEGEEIGDRKMTTEVVGWTKPEGVEGWKSSSGLERTEIQSSQGRRIDCIAA